MVTIFMHQWLQMLCRRLWKLVHWIWSLTHCLMEVLPFKVEELPPENNDNADHQQTTAQEHDDLQAALFDDTDSTFWLGGK